MHVANFNAKRSFFFKYQNANAVISCLCRIFTGNSLENGPAVALEKNGGRIRERNKVEEFEMFEEFAEVGKSMRAPPQLVTGR